MATAKAYGSITIVDISDLGTLSVYPESNQPYSVIYDPNINNGTYSPDWSENNLILSPVVYYGSENIKLTDPNLTVTWTKKIGSNDTSLGGTENVSGKKLIVSSNVLNSNNAIVTYICSIIYTEPQSGTQLKAEGRISFSLIVQPTTIKSCKITGETVFLYNSSQELVSTSPIVLNAKLDNCSITKWAYKNSSGTWTDISSTSTTLSIPANSPYFNGDIATIKIVTDVPELEDIHVISKIRDGAPGDSTVVAILSNEDQMIAFDKNGNPAGGQAAAYADAHTTITVYDGNTDVTADATITPVAGSAITGSWNSTTYTYTVTKITGNGNVQFTIVYGGRTISKTFSLTKIQAGADGADAVTYTLSLSALAVNKTIGGVYTPNAITLSGFSKTGNQNKIAYSGRFKIFLNGSSTADYTSSSNESVHAYTIKPNTTSIRCVLYAAGATSTELDSQTVVVTADGQTGAPGDKGDDGESAYSFILGNYSDVIPCTTGRTAIAAGTIKIPFTAYKGTSRIACAISYVNLPSGVTLGTNSAGTASADGLLTLNIASGATFGGTTSAYDSGVITLTISADGKSNTQNFTWTKNIQAKDGSNAIMLQAFAQKGGIFVDGEGSDTLEALLTDGAIQVSSGASYQWAKFSDSSYSNIAGATNKTLVINASSVESYASYRCTATYGGKTYQAYVSVLDKTDPLQVSIFSSLGDKILNGVGIGAVYATVYQNGTELDKVANITISETAPNSPVTNDLWAQIDSSLKKIIVKKYNGSTWDNHQFNDCSYKWTFLDYNGIAISDQVLTDQSTNKFVYIDGDIINKKIQFNIEVTKN